MDEIEKAAINALNDISDKRANAQSVIEWVLLKYIECNGGVEVVKAYIKAQKRCKSWHG